MADHTTGNAIDQTPPNNGSPSSPEPVTEEVVRRGAEDTAALSNDPDPYSDEENAMIARGKQAMSDLLGNKKKIKVSSSKQTS